MRRVPQQARSQRRIEAILDAACAIIGDIGFEAMTTNMVAERAETSIGSIYQFFENKDAIIRALCDRHLERLVEPLDSAPVPGDPCDVQLGAMLRAIDQYYWTNPGFRAFLFGTYAPREMAIISKHLMQPLIHRFAAVMRSHFADMPEFEAQIHSEVMLYAISRILLFVARMDDSLEARAEMMQKQQLILMSVCRSMLHSQ